MNSSPRSLGDDRDSPSLTSRDSSACGPVRMGDKHAAGWGGEDSLNVSRDGASRFTITKTSVHPACGMREISSRGLKKLHANPQTTHNKQGKQEKQEESNQANSTSFSHTLCACELYSPPIVFKISCHSSGPLASFSLRARGLLTEATNLGCK